MAYLKVVLAYRVSRLPMTNPLLRMLRVLVDAFLVAAA
jgi:hypothetical protein